MFDIVRRVIQARGQKETTVTLLEDLHWFDGGSAAFLEPLIDAVVGTRALVLLNFRPEYQAPWMGKSYYHQLPLAPLGPDAIRELLDALLGNDPSIAGLAEAIHARTAGNPVLHRGGGAEPDRVGEAPGQQGRLSPGHAGRQARGAELRARAARGAHRSAGGAREGRAADRRGDRPRVRRADAGRRRRAGRAAAARSAADAQGHRVRLRAVALSGRRVSLQASADAGGRARLAAAGAAPAAARGRGARHRGGARRRPRPAGGAAGASLGRGRRSRAGGALASPRRRVGGRPRSRRGPAALAQGARARPRARRRRRQGSAPARLQRHPGERHAGASA